MRDGAAIVKALGGRRIPGGYKFRCPAHHDRKPSAAIRDSDGLITCFANCDRRDVEAALDKLGFKDDGQPAQPRNKVEEWAERSQRVKEAQQLWDDALHRPNDLKVIAHYLREQRNILLPVPSVMRRWNSNGYIAIIQQLDGE